MFSDIYLVREQGLAWQLAIALFLLVGHRIWLLPNELQTTKIDLCVG
ncbi:MAG: hypothetical protein HC763_23630 [Hydrococcus sp. CRU_1_1]|nr:hypothetical protein [Hydrococcus sp. CRU_1_1]